MRRLALAVCLFTLSVVARGAENGMPTAAEVTAVQKTVAALGIRNGAMAKDNSSSLRGLSPRLQRAFAQAVSNIENKSLRDTLAAVLPALPKTEAQKPAANGNMVMVMNDPHNDGEGALALLIEKEFDKYGVAMHKTEEKTSNEVKLPDGTVVKHEQKREHIPGQRDSVSNSFSGGTSRKPGETDLQAAADESDRQARSYARGGWYGNAALMYGQAAGTWEKVAEGTVEEKAKAELAAKAKKAREREAKAKELAGKLPDGGAAQYRSNLQAIARTKGQAAFTKAMQGDWPAKPGEDW